MERNSILDGFLLKHNHGLWALLVCLLALTLRLWGISFGLPGIDHGDESEVVNHAVRFGSGDLNPHRFQYGSLVQYFLFIIYGCYYVLASLTGQYASIHDFAVQFVSDPSRFYLIARGVSAFLGAATVWITYLIGKRVRNEGTGILAALLLALCYQHVVHSHYATVDAAVTFLFTCAVYRSLVIISDRRLSMYLYAGFCIGLACGAKFNGIIALAAFATAHFSESSSGPLVKKLLSREWLLGLVAVMGGHFTACPYFYLDFGTALQEISALKAFHSYSGFNLWYYLRDFSFDYWGIPVGALCAIATGRYLITRRAALRLLSVTVIAVVFFASLHRYVEAKYILSAFPAAAVLGAAFLADLRSAVHKRIHPAVVWIVLIVLVMHPLALIIRWNAAKAAKSITLECKEWIEANIPPKSKILLDNAGNAGPKLTNDPENVRRQYDRARAHGLIKAEYLKLLLEIEPTVYYDIVEIDSSAGSRTDDYLRYKLWQDSDVLGQPLSYYCERGYNYIVITDRYLSKMSSSFTLLKQFTRGRKAIMIYKCDCGTDER